MIMYICRAGCWIYPSTTGAERGCWKEQGCALARGKEQCFAFKPGRIRPLLLLQSPGKSSQNGRTKGKEGDCKILPPRQVFSFSRPRRAELGLPPLRHPPSSRLYLVVISEPSRQAGEVLKQKPTACTTKPDPCAANCTVEQTALGHR